MDELINILSNSNKDIDNQKLMDYLSGKLSGDEKHELEKQMADSELVNDAVEGLEQFKDTQRINAIVAQVNTGLHSQLEKKKIYRRRRTVNSQQWFYLALILILSLAIICFVIIKAFHVSRLTFFSF